MRIIKAQYGKMVFEFATNDNGKDLIEFDGYRQRVISQEENFDDERKIKRFISVSLKRRYSSVTGKVKYDMSRFSKGNTYEQK